jgi:hypothetical protein
MRTRIWDEEEKEGDSGVVIQRGGTKFTLRLALYDMAYQDVMTNTTIMVPWLRSDFTFFFSRFNFLVGV